MATSRRSQRGSTRLTVALTCSVCGSRNYKTGRPRRQGQAPIELNKHCKACKRHTKHIESR